VFYNRKLFHALRFAAWWTLIVPIAIWAYLWIENLSEFPWYGLLFEIALVISGVISVVAILATWVGMWIYLFARDDSSFGTKAFWFIVFFLTAWFGSILYFFFVYKQQFLAKSSALQTQLFYCMQTQATPCCLLLIVARLRLR
jgi:hypothetical protein